MPLEITTANPSELTTNWLVVGMTTDDDFSDAVQAIDISTSGMLTKLKDSKDLKGKQGATIVIHCPAGLGVSHLLCVGLGAAESLDRATLEKSWMTALRKTTEKEGQTVAMLSTGILSQEVEAEVFAASVLKAGVSQELYQSEQNRFPLANASLVFAEGTEAKSLQSSLDDGVILGEAINLVRELVNRAPNEIYPVSFSDRASQLATQFDLKIDIFDEERLKEERMNALLAVSSGSEKEARMVVLEHCGAGKDAPVYSIVGKGVTFDSGGHSLKPSEGMKAMKADMTGAACVLGVMTAIARLNLPINIRGYMGLAENMLSGTAYRLGDVLTARNGTTIEVHNTDAEGRLVLADVLAYAVDQGTESILDLATLTGACVVALGEEYTGIFTNDQTWCDQVLNAAEVTGELVWQMPMHDSFNEQLKSNVADCKNVGTRWGGAITAAKFLEKFVDDTPWVHIDIAGPAFAGSKKPHRDGGATGVMVTTLVEMFRKISS